MANEIRGSSHITKEGEHSIHEPFHGLEKMGMSDLTTQVFPEALHRIKLGRIGWQAEQFDLVLMLSQKGLHRFGKVDEIIIHHHLLFASRLLSSRLYH